MGLTCVLPVTFHAYADELGGVRGAAPQLLKLCDFSGKMLMIK